MPELHVHVVKIGRHRHICSRNIEEAERQKRGMRRKETLEREEDEGKDQQVRKHVKMNAKIKKV